MIKSIYSEMKSGTGLFKHRNFYIVLFLLLSTGLSLFLKLSHFDYTSGDYVSFLSSWMYKIKYGGGFVALTKQFYNYTPLYLYILTFIVELDFNYLFSIKVVSILFEYLAAFFIGKIAVQATGNKKLLWISLGVVPLIPSVILNSAFMSQCDALYVSMLLGSAYFLFNRKQLLAMIFLGLAFSLKFQSAFILPFYFIYMVRGQIKWYLFLIVPVVYLFTIMPVWIAGGNFWNLLTIYAEQSAYSYELSSFFPNIYYLGLSNVLGTNKMPGMVFMAILVLYLGWILKNKKYVFTTDLWIRLLFLSAIVTPFFLPGMRERYLYFGDTLVVLYVMINWKNLFAWFVAIAIWFISYYAIAQSLEHVAYYDLSNFDHDWFRTIKFIPWKVICTLYLTVIAYVSCDFVKRLRKNIV